MEPRGAACYGICDMARSGRWIGITVGASLALLATTASASNGTKPRIPVDWSGASCMAIVDRSVDPNLHFTYAITQEDTEITPDEVEDSRTHQFFGFCRAHDTQTFLPRWITQADIDRAVLVGAAPMEVDPEDILESSSEWGDCFERITPDDARIPITFDAAAEGVDWDTSAIPAGTYVIEGYTWEPPLNIWSVNSGVVKVVDDPALEASGPALAVSNIEEVIHRDEAATIHGCVSAMEGSTITAYWSPAAATASWEAFITDDPISGDSFAVDFIPTEEAVGQSLMIRVDVTDPMGRSYTNYMRELVIVLGTNGGGNCEDGVSFIGGEGCQETEGDTGGSGDSPDGTDDGTAGTDGSGSATTSPQDGGGPRTESCACRSQGGSAPISAMLGLLVLGATRRRR